MMTQEQMNIYLFYVPLIQQKKNQLIILYSDQSRRRLRIRLFNNFMKQFYKTFVVLNRIFCNFQNLFAYLLLLKIFQKLVKYAYFNDCSKKKTLPRLSICFTKTRQRNFSLYQTYWAILFTSVAANCLLYISFFTRFTQIFEVV